MKTTRTHLRPEEQKAFEPAEKIGIVACANPHGQPHVSLITSIMAPRPDRITLGSFAGGSASSISSRIPRFPS